MTPKKLEPFFVSGSCCTGHHERCTKRYKTFINASPVMLDLTCVCDCHAALPARQLYAEGVLRWEAEHE